MYARDVICGAPRLTIKAQMRPYKPEEHDKGMEVRGWRGFRAELFRELGAEVWRSLLIVVTLRKMAKVCELEMYSELQHLWRGTGVWTPHMEGFGVKYYILNVLCSPQ